MNRADAAIVKPVLGSVGTCTPLNMAAVATSVLRLKRVSDAAIVKPVLGSVPGSARGYFTSASKSRTRSLVSSVPFLEPTAQT
jgi:hypothetical protein